MSPASQTSSVPDRAGWETPRSAVLCGSVAKGRRVIERAFWCVDGAQCTGKSCGCGRRVDTKLEPTLT